MKRLVFTLALCVSLIGGAWAQGGMGPGPGTVHSTGGGAFSGVGDIVSGASAWYGARAYSTATRGTKAMNVCNVADVVCGDLLTDATTGDLVITTIGGSSCSVVTCTVKILYDQSGNARDASNTVIANRPTLLVSCLSSKPCLVFSGTQELNAPISSLSFQYMENVADITGNFTGNQALMFGAGGANFVPGLGSGNGTANRNYIYTNGPIIFAAATNSAWHAMQGVFASTGIISVDNAETTGALDVSGAITLLSIGSTGINPPTFTGNFVEGGIWNSTPSAGNRTSVSANVRSYWGF